MLWLIFDELTFPVEVLLVDAGRGEDGWLVSDVVVLGCDADVWLVPWLVVDIELAFPVKEAVVDAGCEEDRWLVFDVVRFNDDGVWVWLVLE